MDRRLGLRDNRMSQHSATPMSASANDDRGRSHDFQRLANPIAIRIQAKPRIDTPLLVPEHRVEHLFPHWHNLQRQLPALCRRAGVTVITAKGLQATHVRWLSEAEVPENIARDRVGRGSSRLVGRVYRATTNQDLQAAIRRLPRL